MYAVWMGTTTRVSAFLPLLTIAASAHGQSLYVFEPAAGYQSTVGYGLSDDGTTLAGWLALGGGGGNEKGFLGSTTGYRDDFGLRADMPIRTVAQGVSGDGNYAVGFSRPIGGSSTAFRYNTTTGVHQSLGLFSGAQTTRASDANRDGSVVVGWGTRADGFTTQAFRWTQATGYQAIGGWSRAYAVSGDGNTVVGVNEGAGGSEAFSWTVSGGLRVLENPGQSGNRYSSANGVSVDGRVVVGELGTGVGLPQAAMWIDGRVEVLGRYMDFQTYAHATSGDGAVVGGWFYDDRSDRIGFIWTRATGMVTMAEYLASYGVLIPDGWTLRECSGLSSDGRSVSGQMVNLTLGQTRAFVATIPSAGSLAVALIGLCLTGRRKRT
jgi:uncharacterized membrane protein